MKTRYLTYFLLEIILAWDQAHGTPLRSSQSRRELQTFQDPEGEPTTFGAPSHHFSFDSVSNDVNGGVAGALKGPASYSSIAIEGRKSLQLGCCNASVLLDNKQLKNAFTNYTVSLWFRADSKGGYRYLYEEGSATVGFGIRLNGATLEAAMIEGGGSASNIKVVSAGTVPLKKWQHAVMLYSNGLLSIALNGVVKASVETGYGQFDAHSNPASIGSPGLNNAASNVFFVGLIDDLKIWDGTVLTAQQVTNLYLEGAMSPGMTVSHQWSFDNSATDLISSVTGVLQGPASYSTEAVEGSKSLQLSCCNASVLLDNAALKNAFTNYTVSLWFRAESIGGLRYLYEEGASGTGFAIRLNNAILEVAMIEGGGGPTKYKVVQGGSIQIGQWHHAALLYMNGELSVVFDGVVTATVSTGYGEFAAHSSPASIGAPGLGDFNSGNFFVGLIDDLRIWDGTVLTAEQILDIHDLFAPNLRPNILLIVADDMNFDSPGFMGGLAPNVTPNLDLLASECMLFMLGHGAESVCQASRQAMLSGLYPANAGSLGFWPMADGTPTAVTRLKKVGYITASFYKNHHMRPSSSFPWSMTDYTTYIPGREFRTNGVGKEVGRSPTLLGEATRQTIAAAQAAHKPFFLVINSADPHRPFAGTNDEYKVRGSYQLEASSRVYNASEVTLPYPLRNSDIPGVRNDIANYATSLRRLDDTVGKVLQAVDEAGIANNTIIMFVSDNGMPMPFGKFETYRDSYSGPLLIRWPGRTTPSVDNTTLVSLTDIAPTIIEIAGAEPLTNIYGRSLVPLIDGQPNVTWRDVAVGTRYEDIFYGNHILLFPDPEAFRAQLRAQGWVDAPEHTTPGTMKRTMNKRGITDGTYHYMWNAFYPVFHSNNISAIYEYQMDPSYMSLMEATTTDPDIWARMDFYNHRAPEEFYSMVDDPGSEQNLIGDPDWQAEIFLLKQKLLDWMVETNDPILTEYEAFLNSTM